MFVWSVGGRTWSVVGSVKRKLSLIGGGGVFLGLVPSQGGHDCSSDAAVQFVVAFGVEVDIVPQEYGLRRVV